MFTLLKKFSLNQMWENFRQYRTILSAAAAEAVLKP